MKELRSMTIYKARYTTENKNGTEPTENKKK